MHPNGDNPHGAQIAAFDGLSPGLGQQWVDHVASYADDWETLRRAYLEVPWTPAALPEVRGGVGRRKSMGQDLVVEDAGPTRTVHPDRAVDVLRHGFGRDAADRAQRLDAHERAKRAARARRG